MKRPTILFCLAIIVLFGLIAPDSSSTGFNSVLDANLTIFSTPGASGQLVKFNASYANGTSGTLFDSASCRILITNPVVVNVNMSQQGNYYYFNTTFIQAGTYYYNITCIKSGLSDLALAANDTFTVLPGSQLSANLTIRDTTPNQPTQQQTSTPPLQILLTKRR